jgi:hypothetical protein
MISESFVVGFGLTSDEKSKRLIEGSWQGESCWIVEGVRDGERDLRGYGHTQPSQAVAVLGINQRLVL